VSDLHFLTIAEASRLIERRQLSPVALTQRLGDPEWERLFRATRHVLESWKQKLCAEAQAAFP